jgi:hypothetical protein
MLCCPGSLLLFIVVAAPLFSLVAAGAHKKHSYSRTFIIIMTPTARMVNEENHNNNNNLQPGQHKPLTQYQRWCDSIKSNVGKTLFSDIQFITHEKYERFGSDWQREAS